jgi:polyisoprenoid-binding protein YceI
MNRALWLLLMAGGVLPAQTKEFVLKPSPEGKISLEVAKTGLMSGKVHLFEFPVFGGRAVYGPGGSQVELAVEAGSLVLKDDWVSPKDAVKVKEFALGEMLAARQHPKVEFRSTKAEGTAASGLKVAGMLTIRGRSKAVQGEVEPFDLQRPVFRGTFRFRLTEFGLKPPSAALGAIGTKDEVVLRFKILGGSQP